MSNPFKEDTQEAWAYEQGVQKNVARERERILDIIRGRVKKLREDSENLLMAGDHTTARTQLVAARALNTLAHEIQSSDEGADTGNGPWGGTHHSVLLTPDRRDGEEVPDETSSPKLSDAHDAEGAVDWCLLPTMTDRNSREALAARIVVAVRPHIEAAMARRLTGDTAVDHAAERLRGARHAPRKAAHEALTAGSYAVLDQAGRFRLSRITWQEKHRDD